MGMVPINSSKATAGPDLPRTDRSHQTIITGIITDPTAEGATRGRHDLNPINAGCVWATGIEHSSVPFETTITRQMGQLIIPTTVQHHHNTANPLKTRNNTASTVRM